MGLLSLFSRAAPTLLRLPSMSRGVAAIMPARRGLWVTTISIICSCRWISNSSSAIRAAVVRSRLPVGSSANSKSG